MQDNRCCLRRHSLTSFAGIPVAGWFDAFGARGFNRTGKYTYLMENVTNGNIIDPMAIAGLMSCLNLKMFVLLN